MKAVSFDLVPGGDRPRVKIIETRKPEPARKGDVLVRITHAGLNHGDFEIITGKRNKAVAKQLRTQPVVTGVEMAGIAETNGIRIAVGDRVSGYANIFKGPRFHGEYVVINEEKIFKVPEGWSTEGAAAIIGGGVTVVAALERLAGLKRGDQILITGASGAVGILAVQFANDVGAEVTAICNSRQTRQVKDAGAAQVLAYDKNEMSDPSHKFDCVFDTAPSLTFAKARARLKPRGIYITTMPHLDAAGFFMSLFSRRRWGFLLEADTDQKRLARLAELMAQGVFRPAVDSIFPLDEAANAFARLEERGKFGKVLLDLA